MLAVNVNKSDAPNTWLQQFIVKKISQWNPKLQSTSAEVIPLFAHVQRKIESSERLIFILPAFPAKSSNRQKTLGPEPDFGEFLALSRLQEVCETINSIYPPGAEVIICSDGRVFNDIVGVSDKDLDCYKIGIQTLIQRHNFNSLSTYALEDFYSFDQSEDMRQHLELQFSESVDTIRARVKSDSSMKQLFNGIHRFMKEDLHGLNGDLSKNQIMKHTKKITYQVMLRSAAWDLLLKTVFPKALRLSIHPYPPNHPKFGVQLVDSPDAWATPWHNVPLMQNGEVTLVKHSQAKAMGAKLNHYEGRYAYFQC